MDSCKPHLFHGIAVLSGQMPPPGRTFLYIHDVEPIDKPEHFPVGVIECQLLVLIIEFL